MSAYDRPAISSGPAAPFSAELSAVWDVEAASDYDIRYGRRAEARDEGLIAIRTRSGAGEISLSEQPPLRLEPDSLMLVTPTSLQRYRCVTPTWCFWWFVCKPARPLSGASNTVRTIRGDPRDADDFAQIFSKIQHPDFPLRCVASALFSTMLQRWLASAHLQREPAQHRGVIETVIERIHLDVAENWSGERLARESGLSESAFRTAFKQATGTSPARFIREARLSAAYELCRQRTHTLAAIAEALNFASAFHLSAAFKKHFGVSPSEV